MTTGSLRARLTLTTLVLVAVVLAVVVSAVTLAYRARLDGDLRGQLTHAGAAVERAGSAPAVKRLIPGLALEGIATRFTAAPGTGPAKTSSTVQTHGSLLTLDEVLPDRTRVVFSASHASINRAVTDLLLVEVLVAAAALGLLAPDRRERAQAQRLQLHGDPQQSIALHQLLPDLHLGASGGGR